MGRIATAFLNSARAGDVVLGFAADHGLAMPGAKCTLYDPGLEITLFLVGAGVPAAQRRSDLVSGVDVGPTLWARAGVDAPPGVDGRDLLAGGAPRERVFAEKTFHSYYDPMRAVRSPDAKLIVNFGVGFRVEVPGDVAEGRSSAATRAGTPAASTLSPSSTTCGPTPSSGTTCWTAMPARRCSRSCGPRSWPGCGTATIRCCVPAARSSRRSTTGRCTSSAPEPGGPVPGVDAQPVLAAAVARCYTEPATLYRASSEWRVRPEQGVIVSYENVEVERVEHVGVIRLNRPKLLNALNPGICLDLNDALDELEADFPDIRAIILTGNGRGFCSGADLSGQIAAANGEAPRPGYDPRALIPPLAPRMRRVAQPIIAAVNGVAAGAGFSLSLAADIRIASDQARFASIFVKRALVPDTGSSESMVDLLGLGLASEMAFTGRLFDAQWALDKRLVNSVVPHERLMDEAMALANEIAGNPPLTVRSAKKLLNRRFWLEDSLAHEHDANAPSMPSEDRIEALKAFVEKRPAVYKGR